MGSFKLFDVKSGDESDNLYTRKLQIPQYVPSEIKPSLYELIDRTKYDELLRAINVSDVTEDVKNFLKLAASRHIVFNYSKIADYYSHASKEIQQLMEQSALVIIDIDDAIANGYVRLSDTIKKIMEESGDVTK